MYFGKAAERLTEEEEADLPTAIALMFFDPRLRSIRLA